MGNLCFGSDANPNYSSRDMRRNEEYNRRKPQKVYKNQQIYKRQHRSHPYSCQKRPDQGYNNKFMSNQSGNSTIPKFATLGMCYQSLPPLKPQYFTSKLFVLFNTNSLKRYPIEPFPLKFDAKIFKKDKHVFSPFAANLNKSGPSHWSLINQTLSSQFRNFDDLDKAIKQYSPNLKQHRFDVLECLEKKRNRTELISLVNKIKGLALDLPNYLTQQIPLLKQGENTTIFISQMQIASLLANAFFCTFPWRSHRNKEYATYPVFNFANKDSQDQEQKIEKLMCLFNYFERVINERPNGVVSFERKCLKTHMNWYNSDKQFRSLQVHANGTIEDNAQGFSEADFANKFIGGGVITSGCVQEEIRFLLSPELIVSRLFTECLADNDAMVITGVERFNTGEGYSSSFKFKENYTDHTPRDGWSRRFTQIIAIDAIKFKDSTKSEQFDKRFIDRELNKAYSGFVTVQSQGGLKPAIATGKWGCGAFNGDPYLKCLIQMMAASQADKDLIIFTYNDTDLAHQLTDFQETLKSCNLSVGSIYQRMLEFTGHMNKGNNIIEFLTKTI